MSWHLRQSTKLFKVLGRLGLLLVWVIALFMLLPIVWAANQGDLDPAFGNGGIVMDFINNPPIGITAVALQADNKIVIVGTSWYFSSFLLARYQSNGELDNSFGQGGIVTTTIPNFFFGGNEVAIQTDGKLVVVGYAASGGVEAFALVRYKSNGELDDTFGKGGIVTTTIPGASLSANGIAIQTDGKIVVVGDSIEHDIGSDDLKSVIVARYQSNGELDNSFGQGGIVTTTIPGPNAGGEAVALQSDGKIVVVGVNWSNASSSFLARYKTDGNFDNTFGQGGIVTIPDFFGMVNDVAIQVDGKIVVGGNYRRFDGDTDSSAFALARYRPQGDCDNNFGHAGIVTTTFDTASAFGSGLAIQPDGRIIMVGTVSYQSDDSDNVNALALARYDDQGNLDSTFNSTGVVTTTLVSDPSGWVVGIVIQPDRKIVVAGSFGLEGDGIVLARYLNTLEIYLPLILKNS